MFREAASQRIETSTDRRSVTSKDDLGFTAPLVSELRQGIRFANSRLAPSVPDSLTRPERPPYEGNRVVGRYMWWVAQELNHENPNIDTYAKLLISEFEKLENGEITMEEYEQNTPSIEDETPLNYIRNQIITHYPN